MPISSPNFKIKWRKFVAVFVQIEAIFELGDVDGDGEIELGEFVGQ
jgi:hypothetical protein